MIYRKPAWNRPSLGAQEMRRISASLIGAIFLATGCNRDEALDAFRSGASDQLQAGVQALSTGIINGAFAAFDLKNGDSGSANTSGATADTTTSTDTTESSTTP